MLALAIASTGRFAVRAQNRIDRIDREERDPWKVCEDDDE